MKHQLKTDRPSQVLGVRALLSRSLVQHFSISIDYMWTSGCLRIVSRFVPHHRPFTAPVYCIVPNHILDRAAHAGENKPHCFSTLQDALAQECQQFDDLVEVLPKFQVWAIRMQGNKQQVFGEDTKVCAVAPFRISTHLDGESRKR